MATNSFLAGFNNKKSKKGDAGGADGNAGNTRGAGGGATSAFQSGLQMGQQKKQAGQQKKQTAKAKSGLQKAMNPDRSAVSTSAPDIGNTSIQETPMQSMNLPSHKHGGRIKRTGPAILHRGETVVPAKQGRRKVSGGKQRTYTKP